MNSLYGSRRARGAVFKVRGREAAPLLFKWGGGVGGGGVLKLGCIKILTLNQCKETKDNSN